VKEIEVRLAGLRAKIKRLIDECTLVCSILYIKSKLMNDALVM